MKKYLKKSFAVLTCTTMCIQTTMAILAGKIRGNWYYFTSGGAMQHDTWIEDCYVDSNGIWQQNYRPAQLVEEKMEKNGTAEKTSIYIFRINEKLQWTQQTKVPITREKKSKTHLSALFFSDIISVFQKNQSIFFIPFHSLCNIYSFYSEYIGLTY